MVFHGISWGYIYIYGDIYIYIKGCSMDISLGKSTINGALELKQSLINGILHMALNLCFLMLKHPLPSNGKHGDLLLLLLVTSTGYFALGRP